MDQNLCPTNCKVVTLSKLFSYSYLQLARKAIILVVLEPKCF